MDKMEIEITNEMLNKLQWKKVECPKKIILLIFGISVNSFLVGITVTLGGVKDNKFALIGAIVCALIIVSSIGNIFKYIECIINKEVTREHIRMFEIIFKDKL